MRKVKSKSRNTILDFIEECWDNGLCAYTFSLIVNGEIVYFAESYHSETVNAHYIAESYQEV